MAASLAEGNKERQSTATRLFMQLSGLKVKPEVVVVTVEDGLVDVYPRGITVHVYDEDGIETKDEEVVPASFRSTEHEEHRVAPFR